MSLKKTVVAIILQNILSFTIGFVNSILSTRILGPEGKGILAIYSSSVELFVLLLGVGVPHALLYFSAKDTFNRSQVFHSAVLFLFFSTGLFFLTVMASFWMGWSEFFLPPPFDGPIYRFTLVGFFFFLSGWYIFVSILNGHKLFVETNTISIVSIITYFVLYAFTYYWFAFENKVIGVTAFYWFHLVASLVVLVLCFIYYRRKVSPANKGSSLFLSITQFSSIFKYGLFYFISNLMIFLNSKIDYWFVNYLAGSEELGFYVLASNVGMLIILLPNAIGLALSSYKAGSDKVTVDAQTAKICRISFSGTLLLSIVLWFFGDVVISSLYGYSFHKSSQVLNILLIGIVPYCVFTVLRGYFAGAAKLKLLIRATTAGVLIMLALDIFLIKSHGIFGAAIASVIAYMVSTIYLIRSFCIQNNMKVWKLLLVNRQDFYEIWAAVRSFS